MINERVVTVIVVVALAVVLLVEVCAEDAEREGEVDGPEHHELNKSFDLVNTHVNQFDKVAEGRPDSQIVDDLEESQSVHDEVVERNEHTGPVVPTLKLHVIRGIIDLDDVAVDVGDSHEGVEHDEEEADDVKSVLAVFHVVPQSLAAHVHIHELKDDEEELAEDHRHAAGRMDRLVDRLGEEHLDHERSRVEHHIDKELDVLDKLSVHEGDVNDIAHDRVVFNLAEVHLDHFIDPLGELKLRELDVARLLQPSDVSCLGNVLELLGEHVVAHDDRRVTDGHVAILIEIAHFYLIDVVFEGCVRVVVTDLGGLAEVT